MPARRRAAAPAAPLALLLALGAGAARAQTPCAGHPIRAIHVYPSALFSIEREPFPTLFQKVSAALSWDTRPHVVRRELRFHPGDACDPGRLAESERILRAQPYIRSAVITTAPAPGDSVDIEVTTRDEWSLGGNIRIDTREGKGVKAARVTETNLFGIGVFGQLRYDYFGRKAGLVVDVLDPQLPGLDDAEVALGSSSVGPVGEISLRRTFESEYDRSAWRASARWREEPFVFHSSAFGTVVQPLVSTGADVGKVWRSGPVGRQLLFGAALSGERLFATGDVIASLRSDDSAASAAIDGRFRERHRMSLNLIAGARRIRFVPHAGIDAVNAREDVREGYEIRTIVGAAFGGMGLEEDRFGLVDLYVGVPVGPRTLAFLRSRIEGRWLPAARRWDNVIAAADLFTYTGVSPRGVLTLGVQGAGGWNTSTPFQLLVAGPTALRGFGYSGLPAGRRVVVQAEHRYFLGSVFGAADIGSAAFVDVGRGWAGDAPFGENTGTLVALGLGLRVGFPSGSRFTSRLDVAFPVRGPGSGAEVRLTLRQQFGITRVEASDVERSRMPVSTIALFNFSRY